MVCGIYIIIMEDYILREIDKIGKLIEALLQKAGILRRSGAGEAVCETAWTELAEALDLDIDTLLAREDFMASATRTWKNSPSCCSISRPLRPIGTRRSGSPAALRPFTAIWTKRRLRFP